MRRSGVRISSQARCKSTARAVLGQCGADTGTGWGCAAGTSMSLTITILLLGIVASLSPSTLVVFILLLATTRARVNAAAFLVGWRAPVGSGRRGRRDNVRHAH